MSEMDKHMLEIEGLTPIPREEFAGKAYRSGDRVFKIIEQRRFEQGSVAPNPDNDTFVGVALVVWSPALIAVHKSIGHSECPLCASGKAVDHVFDSLPKRSRVDFIGKTGEVHQAMKESVDLTEKRFDPQVYYQFP
jgi:hypothetical protein